MGHGTGDDDLRFLKMVSNLIGQTVRLHRMVMRDRTRLLEEQSRLSKQQAAKLPTSGEHSTDESSEIAPDSSRPEQSRIVARTNSS